ncbi:MAG: HEAT repeat domain-containing protein [Methanocorpusculum sp.]|nr:HEAT repeat domain-containing protein [Methanocorpusculum sp.]
MSTSEYLALLYSDDKSVRAEAAKNLAGLGSEGVTAVCPLLSSENWVLRYRACEILGLSGCRDAALLLVPYLSDANDHVRYMAAKSIGRIGNPSFAERIRPLAADANPYVSRMANSILNNWGV